MSEDDQNASVSVIDLEEMPSEDQIGVWALQAALTGIRKVVKVKGEKVLEIG